MKPRIGGRQKRITLGRYPTMSLAAARQKATEITDVAKSGGDPAELTGTALTFGETVDRFLTEYAEPRLAPNSVREYRRALMSVPFANKPIDNVTRMDVNATLDVIDRAGHRTTTNRTLSALRRLFNWAIGRGLTENEPMARMKARHEEQSRKRVLVGTETEEELRALWKAIQQEGAMKPLLTAILLTGQRRSEIASLEWTDVRYLDDPENAELVIPGSKMKNKLEHRVPLSPQMVDLLQAIPRGSSSFIFSTNNRSAPSGFSKAKKRLEEAMVEILGKPVPHWMLHDLRRTMVTVMVGKLDVAPHVSDMVIAHISGPATSGVAGIYMRAELMKERREALCKWADYVTRG